jgi:hypothetical protein
MNKIGIAFPIFSSPTQVWGEARGSLEMAIAPVARDSIPTATLMPGMVQFGLPTALRVESTLPSTDSDHTRWATLEPIIFKSLEEVERFTDALEKKCGFFCDEHDLTPIFPGGAGLKK